MPDPPNELADRHERAYDAYERGDLRVAAREFAWLTEARPQHASYQYMLGLAHKYLREWEPSLRANLRSSALRSEPDQASLWNAGIAATALGDWAEARRQWRTCGIAISEGEGPIAMDVGVAAVRVNPWGEGETLYAHRLDPVRACLWSIPLPASGFRYGDVVLHDGASTGRRAFRGAEVPVFNVLARLERSSFETYTVFVTCRSEADIDALLEAEASDLGALEDWTASIRMLCLRCSYGGAHEHRDPDDHTWNPERSLGVAARSRAAVDALLANWQGRDRRVDRVEAGTSELQVPPEGVVWWAGLKQDSG